MTRETVGLAAPAFDTKAKAMPVVEELPVLAYAAMLKAYSWWAMHLVKPDGTKLRGFYIDGMEPPVMYVVRGATFEG